MQSPFRAILQLTDEALNSIADFRAGNGSLEAMLDCRADTATTVNFCSGHKNCIMDDILALSKLDSHFLVVTSVSGAVAERILKIFESELASRDILLEGMLCFVYSRGSGGASRGRDDVYKEDTGAVEG